MALTTYEIAKEITVALVDKLGAQSTTNIETTSKAIGVAFTIILKAIKEAYKD